MTRLPGIIRNRNFGAGPGGGNQGLLCISFVLFTNHLYTMPPYRDWSQVVPAAPLRTNKGPSYNFPHRLYAILSDVSTTPSIAWQEPHGRAFKVRDKEKFELEVLPVYVIE